MASPPPSSGQVSSRRAFSRRARAWLPARWPAFLVDVLLAGAAFAAALWLRVGRDMFGRFEPALLYGLPLFMAAAAVAFRLLALDRAIWRHAGLRELVQIVQAVSLAVLLFLPSLFLATRLEQMPRSVPLIVWFVLIVGLGASRAAVRLLRQPETLRSLGRGLRARRGPAGAIPVVLAGPLAAADVALRALEAAPSGLFRPVGLLAGEPSGGRLHDLPVEPSLAKLLPRLAVSPHKLVLVGDRAAIPRDVRDVWLADARAQGWSLARLADPAALETADAAQARQALRTIAVEDLLGRPQIALDRVAVQALVAGRRVLVTGAGGSIGQELCRQIAALAPGELVLVEQSERALYEIDLELGEWAHPVPRRTVLADIRDQARMARVFHEARPELVFHAAALKHVPLVEANPAEGVLTNVGGTGIVLEAARQVGAAACVMISTDKAVAPASIMGATKRAAEELVRALDREAGPTRGLVVRFGNVLGSTGSVVPLFERQLAAGGPLTVTHPDVERYFMTIAEAVELILQASAAAVAEPARRGRVFVLDMGEPVKIVDLARQMIRLAGLEPEREVAIMFTGLRPGEKLTELLVEEGLALRPTGVPGVLEADVPAMEAVAARGAAERLVAAARQGDEAVRAALAPPKDDREA